MINVDNFTRNIVLTGGNALFPGFKERMESEIRALAPDLMKVEIEDINYKKKSENEISLKM